MTLDERVEAAAKAAYWGDVPSEMDARWRDLAADYPKNADQFRSDSRDVLKAAFPELFTDPPTAWIAPWEATDDMVRACLPESLGEIIERGFEEDFALMRDAHLKPNAPTLGDAE